MKRFTIAILSLTILIMFFVAGCLRMTETEIKPSDEQAIISYEQQETEDEAVNEMSADISDVDAIDDDMDTDDLDVLAQDLNDLDW